MRSHAPLRLAAIVAVVLGYPLIKGAPLQTPFAAQSNSPAAPLSNSPATTQSNSPATTYYVSPWGSDANPGTSPFAPWKTIGKVNSAPLVPGDNVLFQGGQSFSDGTLMPGSGTSASGVQGAPIGFGSYGIGQARITRGVWFAGDSYLAFDGLAFGPQGGFQGGNSTARSDHITIRRCKIDYGPAAAGNPAVGINATGNGWTIAQNEVQNIGNSGMLLAGDSYTISGNVIRNIGLDSGIPYGKHGIYLKVANAEVTGNTITNFSDAGISVRYRNSILTGNDISDGPIGIAWFQYDTVAGTSHWTGNRITNTTYAGIYVSPSDQAGLTRESFVISDNVFARPPVDSRWLAMNLEPTIGTYRLAGNSVQ